MCVAPRAKVLFRRRDGKVTFCQAVDLIEDCEGIDVFPRWWSVGVDGTYARCQDRETGAIEYREMRE